MQDEFVSERIERKREGHGGVQGTERRQRQRLREGLVKILAFEKPNQNGVVSRVYRSGIGVCMYVWSLWSCASPYLLSSLQLYGANLPALHSPHHTYGSCKCC
jgi:hypothetical protein